MPAAELVRLRQQINQLILVFDDPAEFVRKLHLLLDQYANHAYRPGQAVQPQPLLPSYRVPALVTRQLELELGRTCQEAPQQALEVAEALWRDSYLEMRLLAAALLGSVPVNEHGQAVIDRLRAWVQPTDHLRILTALMERGTLALRRESPAALLALIETWLNNENPAQQIIGLHALISLIEDRSFQNLPAIYRQLGPLLQAMPVRLQADLQLALQALVKRSPAETAYLLRQTLSLATNNSTARVVRRLLPEFPPDLQASLRTALQAKSS